MSCLFFFFTLLSILKELFSKLDYYCSRCDRVKFSNGKIGRSSCLMQSILHGIAQAFTKFYVFCGSEITDFRSLLSLQGERAAEEHIWRHQRCQEDCRGRIKNGQAGSHHRWQCKSSSWWRFLQAKYNFNACVISACCLVWSTYSEETATS